MIAEQIFWLSITICGLIGRDCKVYTIWSCSLKYTLQKLKSIHRQYSSNFHKLTLITFNCQLQRTYSNKRDWHLKFISDTLRVTCVTVGNQTSNGYVILTDCSLIQWLSTVGHHFCLQLTDEKPTYYTKYASDFQISVRFKVQPFIFICLRCLLNYLLYLYVLLISCAL